MTKKRMCFVNFAYRVVFLMHSAPIGIPVHIAFMVHLFNGYLYNMDNLVNQMMPSLS